jgi:hypothetical protein
VAFTKKIVPIISKPNELCRKCSDHENILNYNLVEGRRGRINGALSEAHTVLVATTVANWLQLQSILLYANAAMQFPIRAGEKIRRYRKLTRPGKTQQLTAQ